jgi:hypothetical protein
MEFYISYILVGLYPYCIFIIYSSLLDGRYREDLAAMTRHLLQGRFAQQLYDSGVHQHPESGDTPATEI